MRNANIVIWRSFKISPQNTKQITSKQKDTWTSLRKLNVIKCGLWNIQKDVQIIYLSYHLHVSDTKTDKYVSAAFNSVALYSQTCWFKIYIEW